MMKTLASALIALSLALAFSVGVQNQKSDPAAMELRANTAFDKGDFTTALQLYTVLAKSYEKDAAKLGPIQERIKVCQTKVATVAIQQAAAGDVVMTPEGRKPHVR